MQLLLEFSTDHFEAMHACSTLSVDVRVVLWVYLPIIFYKAGTINRKID